jgi:hypothetical protein
MVETSALRAGLVHELYCLQLFSHQFKWQLLQDIQDISRIKEDADLDLTGPQLQWNAPLLFNAAEFREVAEICGKEMDPVSLYYCYITFDVIHTGPQVVDLLKRPFGIDKTLEEAYRYAEKASEEARKLPDSEAKLELEMLTQSIFEDVRR